MFDRPTRYTQNSLFLQPATKQKREARVWVKDTERPDHYLLPQINGGNRPLKRHGKAEHRLEAFAGSEERHGKVQGGGDVRPVLSAPRHRDE